MTIKHAQYQRLHPEYIFHYPGIKRAAATLEQLAFVLTRTDCMMDDIVFDLQIIRCDHANRRGEAIMERAARDVRWSRLADAPDIVECYRVSGIHFGHKALLSGVYKLDVYETCGP